MRYLNFELGWLMLGGGGGGRDLTDTVVRELLQRWGGLFNLEITMVSVLHKELEYKDIVEKLKYKKF